MLILNNTDLGSFTFSSWCSELLKKNSYDLTYAKPYFWRTTQQQEVDYIDLFDVVTDYTYALDTLDNPRGGDLQYWV